MNATQVTQIVFFFSSRRRHTRCYRDWSSDVCSSDLVPVLLFNYVGFELQNGAAEEMENPQRDVPVTVVRSGVLAVILYGIPIFGILAVLPVQKITGISGFLDAVSATFS